MKIGAWMRRSVPSHAGAASAAAARLAAGWSAWRPARWRLATSERQRNEAQQEDFQHEGGEGTENTEAFGISPFVSLRPLRAFVVQFGLSLC